MDEAMEFANELKSNGHCCISYLETYPVQINWCGNKDRVFKK